MSTDHEDIMSPEELRSTATEARLRINEETFNTLIKHINLEINRLANEGKFQLSVSPLSKLFYIGLSHELFDRLIKFYRDKGFKVTVICKADLFFKIYW